MGSAMFSQVLDWSTEQVKIQTKGQSFRTKIQAQMDGRNLEPSVYSKMEGQFLVQGTRSAKADLMPSPPNIK